MALTSAERKRRQREKERSNGLIPVQLNITPEQMLILQTAYNMAGNGDTQIDFFTRSLVTGCMFVANSGGGPKLKRDIVTEGKE